MPTKKETFTKIDSNTFKWDKQSDQSDILRLSELKQEKKELQEQVNPLQERLDEVNRLIKELEKLKK